MLVVMGDAVAAWAGPQDQDAGFTCSEMAFRAYEMSGTPLTLIPASSSMWRMKRWHAWNATEQMDKTVHRPCVKLFTAAAHYATAG